MVEKTRVICHQSLPPIRVFNSKLKQAKKREYSTHGITMGNKCCSMADRQRGGDTHHQHHTRNASANQVANYGESMALKRSIMTTDTVSGSNNGVASAVATPIVKTLTNINNGFSSNKVAILSTPTDNAPSIPTAEDNTLPTTTFTIHQNQQLQENVSAEPIVEAMASVVINKPLAGEPDSQRVGVSQNNNNNNKNIGNESLGEDDRQRLRSLNLKVPYKSLTEQDNHKGLEVSQLKASPTIKISTEWMGDDFEQDQDEGSGVNRSLSGSGSGGNIPKAQRKSLNTRSSNKLNLRKLKTIGERSRSKFLMDLVVIPEENSQMPQGAIASGGADGVPSSGNFNTNGVVNSESSFATDQGTGKQVDQKGNQNRLVFRKQSTIHQISKKMSANRLSKSLFHTVNEVGNFKKNIDSPKASENNSCQGSQYNNGYPKANHNGQLNQNSDFSSQNSYNTLNTLGQQSFSKSKTLIANAHNQLDLFLLNNQQHNNEYSQREDDSSIKGDGTNNPNRKTFQQHLHKNQAGMQITLGISPDFPQLRHSNTPQFNFESYMRGNSHSSYAEDLLHQNSNPNHKQSDQDNTAIFGEDSASISGGGNLYPSSHTINNHHLGISQFLPNQSAISFGNLIRSSPIQPHSNLNIHNMGQSPYLSPQVAEDQTTFNSVSTQKITEAENESFISSPKKQGGSQMLKQQEGNYTQLIKQELRQSVDPSISKTNEKLNTNRQQQQTNTSFQQYQQNQNMQQNSQQKNTLTDINNSTAAASQTQSGLPRIHFINSSDNVIQGKSDDNSPQKILTRQYEIRLNAEHEVEKILSQILNPTALIENSPTKGNKQNSRTNSNFGQNCVGVASGVVNYNNSAPGENTTNINTINNNISIKINSQNSEDFNKQQAYIHPFLNAIVGHQNSGCQMPTISVQQDIVTTTETQANKLINLKLANSQGTSQQSLINPKNSSQKRKESDLSEIDILDDASPKISEHCFKEKTKEITIEQSNSPELLHRVSRQSPVTEQVFEIKKFETVLIKSDVGDQQAQDKEEVKKDKPRGKILNKKNLIRMIREQSREKEAANSVMVVQQQVTSVNVIPPASEGSNMSLSNNLAQYNLRDSMQVNNKFSTDNINIEPPTSAITTSLGQYQAQIPSKNPHQNQQRVQYLYSRNNSIAQNNLNASRDLLQPIKSLTKKIKDEDETKDQLGNMIAQKRFGSMRKDLRKLFKTGTEENNKIISMSQASSNRKIPPIYKIGLHLQENNNDEEEVYDLSEINYTVDAPSEMGGYTPISDNRSASYINQDGSFDYSTLGIEYMAGGAIESTTPTAVGGGHSRNFNAVGAASIAAINIIDKSTHDMNTYKRLSSAAYTQKHINEPHTITNDFQNHLQSFQRNLTPKSFINLQEIYQQESPEHIQVDNNKRVDAIAKMNNMLKLIPRHHSIDIRAEIVKNQSINSTQRIDLISNTTQQQQQQQQFVVSKINLKKVAEDDKKGVQQSKSFEDGTPKSQITRSIISTRDEKGKRKVNQYIIMNDLGKGSYAEVKMCINADDKKRYAMKQLSKRKLNRIFISKTRTALSDVEKEIAIMKKLDHPNIVNLVEVLDDPSVDMLYIIMEYVSNGSLFKKISQNKPFPMQMIWKYFRDLIQGLHYLHECAGVIHRDIKPENLLIDENDRLKIADFGVSFIMENGSDQIATTAGSNYYFSPEVCQGTLFKGRKSDIWASGISLYQMVFKKFPFTSNNIPDLYNKIQNKEVEFPADGNLQLIDLIKKMLMKDPEERISLNAIMEHDWVTSNGVNPFPKVNHPKMELTVADTNDLFTQVSIISKIQLRMKKTIAQKRDSIAYKHPLMKSKLVESAAVSRN